MSRMMPITAMTLKSVCVEHQGQDGAHARRGEGGQDGERVDKAFIEDAQHNINRQQRGDNQKPLAGQGGLVGRAPFPRNSRESSRASPRFVPFC